MMLHHNNEKHLLCRNRKLEYCNLKVTNAAIDDCLAPVVGYFLIAHVVQIYRLSSDKDFGRHPCVNMACHDRRRVSPSCQGVE